MSNQDVVVQLNRDLAGTKVLSVYLNGEETDPAARRAWRIRLNGMLKEVEDSLGEEGEREAVRAAAALIGEELEQYTGLLPGRGWVGFATADRLWYAAPSTAPMPDLVRWEDGAHVAPYVRALKQHRPVTAILVDRSQARIFRYRRGELLEEQVIEAEGAEGDRPSAGAAKRPSSHTGARGESRVDAARRIEEVSTQRMLREVLDAVSGPGTERHLFVLGGNGETVAALIEGLPERARDRAAGIPGLRVDATLAEVKEAVEEAASALSLRLQKALVDEVLDTARSAGRACLGPERTDRALEAGAVDTLILSRAFARSRPDIAEHLVDRALEQGGTVEEISEAAAEELDREGGVGARLRFAV